MGLTERVLKMREDALKAGEEVVPGTFQGISKDKIAAVLKAIDRDTADMQDAVFALLDNQHYSFFTKAAKNNFKFFQGATTAHIACHFGILQRGGGKADREGRDAWLKPLWEIGALEKVYFDSNGICFIAGHPVAKSPNNAYRISENFLAILKAPEDTWRSLLDAWISEDEVRKRLKLQASMADEARITVDTKHSSLIQNSCDIYARRFLKGFEVIFIDDGDGDRVTESQRESLNRAGISITLEDSMPDVLLWNSETDYLGFPE